MTDITSSEQMILFVQYFSRKSEKVEAKFLCIKNVLEHGDSAYAETITSVICKSLESLGLEVSDMSGMASDGASVMLGPKSELEQG